LQQSSSDWLQNCIWYAFCVPVALRHGTEPPTRKGGFLGVVLAVAYNHCQCIAQQGAIIEQCVVATTPSLPVLANCQAICLCELIASALGGLEAIIAQTAQVKNSSDCIEQSQLLRGVAMQGVEGATPRCYSRCATVQVCK
tara:strand:- start:2045 stop:2467 length:423 start_codon:yes stop_codon:yes gene_type:complete